MASEQQMRRENTTSEREVEIEKDKVPKITTHFEALRGAEGKDTSLGASSCFSSSNPTADLFLAIKL
ncbi:unnamed protein product [Prunus armeniaca]